jgi:hypothetical protein
MTSDTLRTRLTGGVAAAAARTRPGTWAVSRTRVLDDPEMGKFLQQVADTRLRAVSTHKIGSIITELQGLLAQRRHLLLGLLFGSDPVIAEFPRIEGELDTPVFDQWFQLCWLAEASWRALHGELTDSDFATGDRELLYPLAARLRFHVLSEPMRFRTQGVNPWLPEADIDAYGLNGLIGQVFGDDSWNVLVGYCREARWTWLSCLNDYQSHPLLAYAEPKELEAELSWLVFARRHGGWPLCLSVRSLADPVTLTAEDRAVIEESMDRHLLPRFRVLGVASLALHADHPSQRVARIALALLTGISVVLALLLAVQLRLYPAMAFAIVSYVLIGIGSLVFGSWWAAPWLLRLPAACAVGLAVLLTLPPAWWQAPRPAAAGVLAGAALGYLLVEARNHNVGRGAALGRCLAVAGFGVMHGLLVSLIGLGAIAPSFVDHADALTALWGTLVAHPQAGMILLLSTCWCLAVGVFSQILWDDRPVTARLAHLSWRSGSSI